MKEFKIGDKAVYPAHGVGEITAIETKEISGNKISFYILKILENDMTIMIPKNNITSCGLREVISRKDVSTVYGLLKKKGTPIDTQTWNRRYREYMKKIRTGSVYEIAEVIRDLYVLKNDKPLSFGEKKMLDTAKSLLIREISIAKKTAEMAVEKEIKQIFNN